MNAFIHVSSRGHHIKGLNEHIIAPNTRNAVSRPTPSSLIEFSSFSEKGIHSPYVAHGRPADRDCAVKPRHSYTVTFVHHLFSIPYGEHKSTAPITHTAGRLQQECELMSRTGQVNEGWR